MKKINLLEAIVLSVPILFSSCSKMINPIGMDVETQTVTQSGYNGGSISASKTPQYKQYTDVEAKVNEGAYETVTGNNGTYTKTVNNAENGNYVFDFNFISGDTETKESVTVPCWIDENQSDTALDEALSVLVSSAPVVNDIKNYQKNYNESGKTWDLRILIEKGSGNTGFYFVDFQGTENENAQTIAPYVGAGYKYFTSEESNSISTQNLKHCVTNHLLTEKLQGWTTITSW